MSTTTTTPTPTKTPTSSCRHVFKVALVGDSGVGKTSLARRFADDTFHTDLGFTVGVEFKVKRLDMGADGLVHFEMWDTAGQERFRSLVPSYFRGVQAAIVVYDVTNLASFEHVTGWLEEMEPHKGRLCVLLLVGNKVDAPGDARVVPFDKAQALADSVGMAYMETSAKEATNVDATFTSMARAMLEVQKANQAKLGIHHNANAKSVSLAHRISDRLSTCC